MFSDIDSYIKGKIIENAARNTTDSEILMQAAARSLLQMQQANGHALQTRSSLYTDLECGTFASFIDLVESIFLLDVNKGNFRHIVRGYLVVLQLSKM